MKEFQASAGAGGFVVGWEGVEMVRGREGARRGERVRVWYQRGVRAYVASVCCGLFCCRRRKERGSVMFFLRPNLFSRSSAIFIPIATNSIFHSSVRFRCINLINFGFRFCLKCNPSSLLGKIEEANLHKKKRLAARSEMISLAKALETERDGHKAMGHALQYSLMPKAIDQATVLERVVMMAERSLHSLSRASGVRLASSLQV